MSEYRFTLRFDVSGVQMTTDDMLDRLAAEGCDDAAVGVGTSGRLALAFDRDATSATQAASSAARDVHSALPGAKLLGASPDIVGLSDIAELVGRTRQNMRKLLVTGGGAPAPLHEGSSLVWHLALVLVWLREEKAYAIPDDLIEVARTTMQVNLAVEARLADRAVQKELRTLVG